MFKVRSIADNVRQYLEDLISQGNLHPGQQVREQEIASMLGISRPPIREAFKLLEAEGLLTRRPNRGVFVAEITRKDAWEVYTLKSALYDFAAKLAFDRITQREVRLWDSVIQEMEGCVASHPPDVVRYQELNQRFHGIMLDLTGHKRLKRMLEMLHNQVKRFSYLSLADTKHMRESLEYHRAILQAIKQGDRELTGRLSREHVAQALALVQGLITAEERRRNQGSPKPEGEVRGHQPEDVPGPHAEQDHILAPGGQDKAAEIPFGSLGAFPGDLWEGKNPEQKVSKREDGR